MARADRLPDWDDELTGEVISHFGAFAEGRIAPLDSKGDAQGCRLKNGRVRMPDGFREVYRELSEQGWQGLSAPEEYGGQGLSSIVLAGVSEIFTGANHSLQMVCSLAPAAISTLRRFGSNEQKSKYIPLLAEGRWLSTMALTEPGAGSDLSAIRTRAVSKGDHWQITGEKIFISGGDQDMSEGILHLVLARSGSADSGTRGLSLFACPSEFDDRELNSITATRIEEKLGLHASPTCQMVFDNSVGYLVGEEGLGLKAMFAMMNHARVDVGLQGIAHAARAADLASSYAQERVQGRDAQGAAITIDRHADVAQMIDTCDALALGGRALCHITLVAQELGTKPDFVEFMTPICKYFCTEAGIRAADLAIQVMGGYGYLLEYGAEQNWRDARICAIYEGTNGIHARTTATRSLSLNGGAGARAFSDFVRESGGDLAGELADWDLETQKLADMPDASLGAHAFMERTCALAYRAAWARISAVAGASSDASRLHRLKECAIRW